MIFLLPWLIGLIFFFLRPLFLTFYYAFNSMEMESGVFKGTFNGIEKLKYALGVDADFTKDLASAFTSMLTNVPIQIFVSLFIAILLNGQFKGRGFFRAIFFIPIILATGITTIELSEVSLTAQTSESVVNLDWLTDLNVNRNSAADYNTSDFCTFPHLRCVARHQVFRFDLLSGLQAISPTILYVAQLEEGVAVHLKCSVRLHCQ